MIIRLALLAIAAVVLSLALLPASAMPVAATLPCPPNPSPPDPADPSMILNAPVEGATVTSPVHVSGLARVFEANVRITIYSVAGMVLQDTFTTAAEAGPALAPFSAQVSFAVLEEQAGCIRVWEESAMDGSPRNVVQVQVNLSPADAGATATPAPAATQAPISPPDTGGAGLAASNSKGFVPAALIAGVLLMLSLRLIHRGGVH